MTKDQKITWIQYFEYLHGLWCEQFATNLALGQCVEKSLKDNIIITNFIDLFYTYKAIEEPITNSFKLIFTSNNIGDTYEFYLTLNSEILVETLQTNDLSILLPFIVSLTNTTYAPITSYYAVQDSENSIIFYTTNPNEVYALPNTLILPVDNGLTVSVTTEDYTSIVLDSLNCLSIKQMCDIKNRLLVLLKNCNCN